MASKDKREALKVLGSDMRMMGSWVHCTEGWGRRRKAESVADPQREFSRKAHGWRGTYRLEGRTAL
jgi:hypothetical protein